jgi:hypothetical protein
MRWEMLEQGSERERDITMCIRIVQVITESLAANRKVTAIAFGNNASNMPRTWHRGIADIRASKTEKD